MSDGFIKCDACADPYGWWEFPADWKPLENPACANMFVGMPRCPRCFCLALIEEMAPAPTDAQVRSSPWTIREQRHAFQVRREAAVRAVMPLFKQVEAICRRVFLMESQP